MFSFRCFGYCLLAAMMAFICQETTKPGWWARAELPGSDHMVTGVTGVTGVTPDGDATCERR